MEAEKEVIAMRRRVLPALLLTLLLLGGSFLLFCLYGIDCACDSHKQHQQKNPHPKVSLPDSPDISPVSGFVSSRARSVFCSFFRSLCV